MVDSVQDDFSVSSPNVPILIPPPFDFADIQTPEVATVTSAAQNAYFPSVPPSQHQGNLQVPSSLNRAATAIAATITPVQSMQLATEPLYLQNQSPLNRDQSFPVRQMGPPRKRGRPPSTSLTKTSGPKMGDVAIRPRMPMLGVKPKAFTSQVGHYQNHSRLVFSF